jgi:hypothetical protein
MQDTALIVPLFLPPAPNTSTMLHCPTCLALGSCTSVPSLPCHRYATRCYRGRIGLTGGKVKWKSDEVMSWKARLLSRDVLALRFPNTLLCLSIHLLHRRHQHDCGCQRLHRHDWLQADSWTYQNRTHISEGKMSAPACPSTSKRQKWGAMAAGFSLEVRATTVTAACPLFLRGRSGPGLRMLDSWPSASKVQVEIWRQTERDAACVFDVFNNKFFPVISVCLKTWSGILMLKEPLKCLL